MAILLFVKYLNFQIIFQRRVYIGEQTKGEGGCGTPWEPWRIEDWSQKDHPPFSTKRINSYLHTWSVSHTSWVCGEEVGEEEAHECNRSQRCQPWTKCTHHVYHLLRMEGMLALLIPCWEWQSWLLHKLQIVQNASEFRT